MRRSSMIAPVAVASLALIGCGGEPKLVPVTGLVRLDGKPVDGVRVYFWPLEQSAKMSVNQLAIGFSDKEGKFSLRGTNGDGIAAGEYKVTFARPMTRAGRGVERQGAKPGEVGAAETLSKEQTDQSLTKHRATVSESSHDFVFDLPSK